MANGVFNVALGRAMEFYLNVDNNDPGTAVIRLFLMQANETEATLIDRDTISAVFAEAGSTEATFTNYTNKSLTDTDIAAPTLDDTGDQYYFTLPDTTWTTAGNGTNNTLTKLLVSYDEAGTDTDASTIPMTHHDFAVTTDGSDLTADFGTTVYTAT